MGYTAFRQYEMSRFDGSSWKPLARSIAPNGPDEGIQQMAYLRARKASELLQHHTRQVILAPPISEHLVEGHGSSSIAVSEEQIFAASSFTFAVVIAGRATRVEIDEHLVGRRGSDNFGVSVDGIGRRLKNLQATVLALRDDVGDVNGLLVEQVRLAPRRSSPGRSISSTRLIWPWGTEKTDAPVTIPWSVVPEL